VFTINACQVRADIRRTWIPTRPPLFCNCVPSCWPRCPGCARLSMLTPRSASPPFSPRFCQIASGLRLVHLRERHPEWRGTSVLGRGGNCSVPIDPPLRVPARAAWSPVWDAASGQAPSPCLARPPPRRTGGDHREVTAEPRSACSRFNKTAFRRHPHRRPSGSATHFRASADRAGEGPLSRTGVA